MKGDFHARRGAADDVRVGHDPAAVRVHDEAGAQAGAFAIAVERHRQGRAYLHGVLERGLENVFVGGRRRRHAEQKAPPQDPRQQLLDFHRVLPATIEEGGPFYRSTGRWQRKYPHRRNHG